ncbi:MAG: serine/threonine protein kinase [bacterium]|nr:serine/threonine protein kinase [bacterium]
MPDPKKSIEQVIAEIVRAVERHEQPCKGEYLARYPGFARELEDFFEMHERFDLSRDPPEAELATIASAHPAAPPAMLKTQSVASPRKSGDDISLTSNPPRFLGDYEILEEIDRGGMGVVYKARHQQLHRIVALKLIRSGELASHEEIQRFLSEAEAAASLSHPGIVPIYEVGTYEGLVYYTMAYIEGKNLAEMVADGPMEANDAIRITHKLCQAVESAHQSGIYHRDLKPANVLINNCGQPVIIDFGLAKITNRDDSLTATGQMLGTPAYMAPEHAAGKVKNAGPAADLYALGGILYFLCTGQHPFSGRTAFDVLIQVLDRRPPNPSNLNRKIGHELDQICLRMLEKDPEDRYPSATAFASDLQKLLTGEPIDLPQVSLSQKIIHWWQREPILVSHVAGIGLTTMIVIIAQLYKPDLLQPFYYRLILLLAWLAASFVLQYWSDRSRWRYLAILTWLTVDVLVYTTLIGFARPPKSMLLIGYPMMIVASSLFYQRRYTVSNTIMCILGFSVLAWLFPDELLDRWDFGAIFVCGMVVICLSMLAMIHRIRGMSRFYEE